MVVDISLMPFEYKGITYSFIPHKRIPRVSTGTLDKSKWQANAVPSNYGPELVIPEQVEYNGRFYIVT